MSATVSVAAVQVAELPRVSLRVQMSEGVPQSLKQLLGVTCEPENRF